MNDALNNARGWWDVFFGDRTPAIIPQPAKQKTLEDFGWVKGSDNVYRQPKASPIPTPQASMLPTSKPNPTNIDWLEQNVLPFTRKVGLPDALVAGQWAIEDRRKDTSMFNLMFGGKVHKYQNYENNVNDYIRTVTNILKDKGYDIGQIKDPKQILTILQDVSGRRYEAHSKDPMDYVKITSDTPEYKYYLQ